MAAESDDESGPIEVALRELPEALDRAVYVQDKWPLVVDPTGQAARFLKYQRGSFLATRLPGDMVDTNLRKCLVGALRYASWLVIDFGDDPEQDIAKYFSPGHFPEAAMTRSELYKEEVWSKLLRADDGDPSVATFLPRDEFKLIIVTTCDPAPADTAARMCVVKVTPPEETKQTEDEVMAAAYGLKFVKRNSKDMVESAFDGDIDDVKKWLEKGYDLESEDGHKHTAISEAACQGHDELVAFLLSAGANPNAVNDQGRSPLYRAAFNGHANTVSLLLKSGADMKLKDRSLQGPFDVTQDEACRKLLSDWDYAETERLLEERAEAMRIQREERLRTAAERDVAARIALRDEAVEKTIAGDCEGLVELLERAALEAMNEAGGRPRVKAEVRDQRGNTLLALAAWHGHFDIVKMLITKYKEFHKTLEETDYKTFKTNINSRDNKGWTPVSIAAFHDRAKIVRLLLEHGANPRLPNFYHKTAWHNAEGKPEVLAALQEWERSHVSVKAEDETKGGDATAADDTTEQAAAPVPATAAAGSKKKRVSKKAGGAKSRTGTGTTKKRVGTRTAAATKGKARAGAGAGKTKTKAAAGTRSTTRSRAGATKSTATRSAKKK